MLPARSPRALMLATIAVALALATARLVAADLATLHQRARDAGDTSTMVVARRDLFLGETVHRDDIETRIVHRSEQPVGAVARRGRVERRVVVVPVLRGAPVLERNLADPDQTGSAGIVPRGMRAVDVPFEGRTRPTPGERVDILVTFDPVRADTSVEPTLTVVRGALVTTHASGPPDVGADAPNDEAVTVLVPEETVGRLAFAIANGVLTLAVTPPEALDEPLVRSDADHPE